MSTPAKRLRRSAGARARTTHHTTVVAAAVAVAFLLAAGAGVVTADASAAQATAHAQEDVSLEHEVQTLKLQLEQARAEAKMYHSLADQTSETHYTQALAQAQAEKQAEQQRQAALQKTATAIAAQYQTRLSQVEGEAAEAHRLKEENADLHQQLEDAKRMAHMQADIAARAKRDLEQVRASHAKHTQSLNQLAAKTLSLLESERREHRNVLHEAIRADALQDDEHIEATPESALPTRPNAARSGQPGAGTALLLEQGEGGVRGGEPGQEADSESGAAAALLRATDALRAERARRRSLEAKLKRFDPEAERRKQEVTRHQSEEQQLDKDMDDLFAR